MWKVMSFLVQNSTFGNDQSWPDTCFRRREGSNLGGNRTLGASRPAKIGSQHGSVLGCFLHCGGHKIWNLLILHVSTCQMSTLSQDMPSFRSLCAEDMSENWSHEICQSTSQKRCEKTCQKTLRSCQTINVRLICLKICRIRFARANTWDCTYMWEYMTDEIFGRSAKAEISAEWLMVLYPWWSVNSFFSWTFFGFVSKKMVNPPFVDDFPIKTSIYRRIPAGRAYTSPGKSNVQAIWSSDYQVSKQSIKKNGEFIMYMGVSINGDTKIAGWCL